MPSTPWEYSRKARRYRDTRTGRFLSTNALYPLRDAFKKAQGNDSNELTRRLYASEITLQEWVTEFRAALKTSYLDQYLMARGGRHVATQSDFGTVGRMLRDQYGYLQRFAEEIGRGEISEEAAKARGRLYFASGTQAFERGKAAGAGISLPDYPGSGSTPCRTQCACHWQLEDEGDHVNAYWRLGSTEHCGTCISRSRDWAPYVARKG